MAGETLPKSDSGLIKTMKFLAERSVSNLSEVVRLMLKAGVSFYAVVTFLVVALPAFGVWAGAWAQFCIWVNGVPFGQVASAALVSALLLILAWVKVPVDIIPDLILSLVKVVCDPEKILVKDANQAWKNIKKKLKETEKNQKKKKAV